MSYYGLKINGRWETTDSASIGDYVAIATNTYSGTYDGLSPYYIGCGKYTWGDKIYMGYPNQAIVNGQDGFDTGFYKWVDEDAFDCSYNATSLSNLDYNMYSVAFKRSETYDVNDNLHLITNINLKKCVLSVTVNTENLTVDGESKTVYSLGQNCINALVGDNYKTASQSASYIQFFQTNPINSTWSLNNYFPNDLSLNPVHSQAGTPACVTANKTRSYKYVSGNVYYIDGETNSLLYKTGYNYNSGPEAQITACPAPSGIINANLATSASKIKYFALNNVIYKSQYNNTGQRETLLIPYGFTTIDACLTHIAKLGFSFVYDNARYKPVASGGLITGYTSDLDEQSEWDNWTTIDTINRTPSSSDYIDLLDDIGFTLNANGSSFIRWYAVTSSQMTSLLSWLNTPTPLQGQEIPAGFNAMSHIIGCHQAPFSISNRCNTTSANIVIGGLDTEISASLLGNQGSNSTIDLGSVEIIRRHNNFLDYEPYTKIDLYIPYCGVVSLPPSVFMGRTLSVKLIFDIFSGECHGCVFTNNTFYTSISGNITSMLAVSSENVGAIKQAMVNGIMSIVGGGVATVTGVATGNIPTVVGGAVTMLGGTAKSIMEMNGISPEMRGSSGGRASFYKPSTPILYMSTPAFDIDDGYITENGLGVNKTVTLSAGEGFVVVPNPVIDINATATEKAMIENAFKTGVIL